MESHSSRFLFDKMVADLDEHYELQEAKAIIYLLLEERLGLSKVGIALNEPLQSDNQSIKIALNNDIKRLKDFVPVQYVLGSAPFGELNISVKPGVLIPRPETEEIVQIIQREFGKYPYYRVADLGTGSGAIALLLKYLHPSWDVIGVEFSEEALVVCHENQSRLQIDVTFRQGDMLHPLPALGELDLVVSNPPYVMEDERTTLEPNVIRHEPELALFVPDEDPLKFYKAIAHRGQEQLKPGGWIYVEMNEALGHSTAKLFEEHGYEKSEVIKDFLGKDRFVRCQKSK